MKKMVSCIAQNPNHAERIIKQLLTAGFSTTEVSVLMSGAGGAARSPPASHLATSNAGSCAVGTEGQFGEILAQLSDFGTIDISGLGPSLSAGPLRTVLTAVAPGGSSNELRTKLMSVGIGDFEARRTEAKLKGGNVLICVKAEFLEQQERAATVLHAAYAVDVCTTGVVFAFQSTAPPRPHGDCELEHRGQPTRQVRDDNMP